MNQRFLKYRTIDKASITRDVFRQLWAIILFSIAVSLLVNTVANQGYSPEYSTSVTFVVTTRGTNTSIYKDIDSASDTASRFQTILQSGVFKRAIAKNLNLRNYDAITEVKLLEETNLITLTVKHKSALRAYQYIRAIIENYNIVSDYVIKNVVLEVIQEPKIPVMPSNPNKAWYYSIIGWLMGFAVAIGYVAFFSYLKDTVKNPHEASSKLAARLLGTVYRERIKRERRGTKRLSMLITNPILSFKYVESCRMMASRVLNVMNQKGVKVLLVTSVAENEGKSTIASNIALSMAQEGKKVLLIDADFRKPSVYKLFDVEKDQVPNFVEMLRTGTGVSNSIIKLKKYPLFLILNNTNTGTIEDVLANKRLASLLHFAYTTFDYVILDTAPMGLVPDAEGIASLCDASLMIVKEDTILAKNINDAIDTLNGTQAKVLGVVFNNAKSRGRATIRAKSVYNYSSKK